MPGFAQHAGMTKYIALLRAVNVGGVTRQEVSDGTEFINIFKCAFSTYGLTTFIGLGCRPIELSDPA